MSDLSSYFTLFNVLGGIVVLAGTIFMVFYLTFWVASAILLVGRMSNEDVREFSHLLGLLSLFPAVVVLSWVFSLTGSNYANTLITALVVMFVFLLVMYTSLQRTKGWKNVLKGQRGEEKVRRVLARSHYEAFHDLYIETEGRFVQIDHVVKAGSRIVVVETKNYDKPVFGKAGDNQWATGQNKSIEHNWNPLVQNQMHLEALASLVHADLDGVVVVMDFAEFPKGEIPGVIRVSQLPLYLESLASMDEPQDRAKEAWALIEKLASTDKQNSLREKHKRDLLRKHVERGFKRIVNVQDEHGKPSSCIKCNGSEFDVAEATLTPFTWKCRSCGQWHYIKIGNDTIRKDGNDFYRVRADGTGEYLMHSNPAPIQIDFTKQRAFATPRTAEAG